jgi:hypothetical protein
MIVVLVTSLWPFKDIGRNWLTTTTSQSLVAKECGRELRCAFDEYVRWCVSSKNRFANREAIIKTRPIGSQDDFMTLVGSHIG